MLRLPDLERVITDTAQRYGRLDVLLSTPQTRRRVVLRRFAAHSTAVVFSSLVVLVTTLGVSNANGVALDQGNVIGAALGFIPLALLIGAIGYLGAGWLRTAADTGLLSFVLAFWFFVSFIGRDLGWPDAAMRLSPFTYYGDPLVNGLAFGDVAALIGVGALALLIGVWRFARKDIAV